MAEEKRQETAQERRRKHEARFVALKAERASWDAHWRQLAENFRPRGSRFLTTEKNRGERRNVHIHNGTPLKSLRTLVAGMYAFITPPERKWFSVTVVDSELAELTEVKQHCEEVETLVAAQLARSNFYRVAPVMFGDLSCFGTHVTILEADDEDGMRGYPCPVGSYCLANDRRNKPATLYRQLRMTVEQLVEEFGLEACSVPARRQYEDGRFDAEVEVHHCITRNHDYEEGAVGTRGMRFVSLWWEAAASQDVAFLRESGFRTQPFIAARWDSTGEDVYGSSPAMEALGDAEKLQAAEWEKEQQLQLLRTPPMQGPASLAAKVVGLLPGDFTAVPDMVAGAKVTPAVEYDPRTLQAIMADIAQKEARIEGMLYVDLWVALQARDKQMTAREVGAIEDEKFTQLSVVNAGLSDEGLDVVVNRTIDILAARGELPQPPQALLEAGETGYKLEYISPFALAQKMQGTTGLQRLMAVVGQAAQLVPEVLDKLDVDQTVDEFARALGVTPKVVRGDDEVQALRQRRAEAQQAAQQVEEAQQAAKTAKTLAETPTQGETALRALLRTTGAKP